MMKKLGYPSDVTVWFDWFEKAAVQNDVVAQNNLAIIYDSGLGVRKDPLKAIYWYEESANEGGANSIIIFDMLI